MTHLQLSHPWRWHRTRDVLEVGVDVTEADARRLVRSGRARDVLDVIGEAGKGGWYVVPLSGGNSAKVRGVAAAVRALKEDAW